MLNSLEMNSPPLFWTLFKKFYLHHPSEIINKNHKLPFTIASSGSCRTTQICVNNSSFSVIENFFLGNDTFFFLVVIHSLQTTLVGFMILGKSLTSNVLLPFTMLSKFIWQNLLCHNQLLSTFATKHIILVGFN